MRKWEAPSGQLFFDDFFTYAARRAHLRRYAPGFRENRDISAGFIGEYLTFERLSVKVSAVGM